jgi:hypothetical protein
MVKKDKILLYAIALMVSLISVTQIVKFAIINASHAIFLEIIVYYAKGIE